MKRKTLSTIVLLVATIVGSDGVAQEPKDQPAIRIRLTHPDEQLQEVLGWFKDSKAANPAAALAAWKRASKEPNRLGKPFEALISSLNPKMVDELKTLDDAEVSIRFNPETGQPEWSAILPKDDGTFSALASALVLSGGSAEAPMGEIAVDRLAGPGSPLMAKVSGGTLLASSREELQASGVRLADHEDDLAGLRLDGIQISVAPGALKGSKSLMIRRIDEILRPEVKIPRRGLNGAAEIDVSLSLGSIDATIVYHNKPPAPKVPINPRWLDWIPRDRAMFGFAFTTDPGQESWDTLFALADRVEKLDSARENVLPLQVRIDLLTKVVGLRAQTDLMFHLVGTSGWIGSNGKALDAALVMFHLDDQVVAERIVANLKPLPGSGPLPPTPVGQARSLGTAEGRTLRVSRLDRSVILEWGDGALEASIKARDHLDQSAGPEIRQDQIKKATSSLYGALWPGRIPGIWVDGSPLKRAMVSAPPLFWEGAPDERFGYFLNLRWSDIDETLKRFLESLPLDPPPDH